MTNVAERLLTSPAASPQAAAIRADGRTLNRAELADASARLAAFLVSKGVSPGARVGLMLPNVPEFAVGYYGILLAGAVAVPMNPLLMRDEVAHYLSDAGARLLLSWPDSPGEPEKGAAAAGAKVISASSRMVGEWLSHVAPLPPVARGNEDLAVLLYTSGTAGKPKGAALSHANLRRNAEVFGTEWLGLDERDVVIGCLPMFHTFGQTVALNCSVLTGACLTLLERFSGEEALRVIERDRVSLFVGVPTMYSALLAAAATHRRDTTSLRMCLSGGAALPVEVLRSVEERFGAPVLEGYGLSETSPVASFNPLDGARKIGSVGIPIHGVEMAILDDTGRVLEPGQVGEIAIRGHNVMLGYWNLPEATAEVLDDAGWFRTGDLGRTDHDGYYYIVDRKKSLIIRGGYNVYPREIEDVLYAHPAVFEAAVVGMPHPTLGEEVGAAVVLSDPDADPAEIREWVRTRVAAYKYPRHVWSVDALPKGPSGKILRREVRPPLRFD